MRKLFISFFLLIFLATTSMAQGRIFHAGLLGGVSFSQVLNDGLSHYSKLGFYGGGFISTDFNELWSGEIGFTYVMKGSKERFTSNATYDGYKMTLGYVEFPFIAKVRFQKIQVEFGLSVGILVNSNEENWYQDQTFSASEFEPFELAGIVGVNYNFNDKWGLDLRSSNSIFPIRYPTDNVYHPPFYGQRNIILTLAVRYFIR
jgi:hypothetical protein